ncbi:MULTISPECIES: transporter substrate-binding domain-containing protein [unclassified Pseudomonas]|uniref:substrate-binding periplasmic protein n=1 Tax=unclassified Pseudomonas TaxID=196821 RepID=UPI0011ECBFFC|nr:MULTISPECIES: transporter substrate-binding domain-containing protein [unclassified Pseudomonas]KAA0944567.1 transporter substrate-binding domain-containing protein [Pseudomonas sp. ANT_H4]KAA0951175.1 transporter substrate-binding domain-containing protein [Pseudomonas sp. ANT_H14]
MDGRRRLLVLLCALVFSVRADDIPTVPDQINLASEAWKSYTNEDGSGLAWDVLRQVFEPVGVKVKTRSVPYTRSVGLAQRGEVDAYVGAYRDETESVRYARWHYDSDHIYALGLASTAAPTLATLGNYRLAWVRGYKYDTYLPNIHTFNQIERRDGILPMLLHKRADLYIDALTEARYTLDQAPDPLLFKLTHLVELPLFLGFTDNERGRALMALFDQRMDVLVKNGELKPIFERWHQPYPF